MSSATKSNYGHANKGKKRGGVAPTVVEVARPVQIKAPSKASEMPTAKYDQPTELGQWADPEKPV